VDSGHRIVDGFGGERDDFHQYCSASQQTANIVAFTIHIRYCHTRDLAWCDSNGKEV
jgi:hypothetical protein